MSTICKGERKMRVIKPVLKPADWEFLLREQSSVGLTKKLLNNGIDVDATDSEGYTALHYAVSDNNLEKAKLLVRKGANVNAKARYGISPLFICSLFEYPEMSEFLLKNKAESSSPRTEALSENWGTRMSKVYNPVHVKLVKHFVTKAGTDCDVEAGMTAYCRLGKRARLKQVRRIRKALEEAAALAGVQLRIQACA